MNLTQEIYALLYHMSTSCRRIAELRKKDDYEETEADAVRQTAVEAEDQWEVELNTFTPASRVTGVCVGGGCVCGRDVRACMHVCPGVHQPDKTRCPSSALLAKYSVPDAFWHEEDHTFLNQNTSTQLKSTQWCNGGRRYASVSIFSVDSFW